MNNRLSVELCCGSLEDCKLAERAGADRIELVSAHLLGGLTPSVGLVALVKEQVSLPVSVMVRPRGAGFCYSDEDFSVMCEDARRFSRMGADGIVFGFLTAYGRLDYERCARFLDCTGSCETVFHRAIDVAENMFDAVSKLISLGVTRVLTSGGCADALTGAPAIRTIQQMYGDRIQILAGGGVRAGNILRLVEETGVSRVHLSGAAQVSDPSTLLNPTLNFGSSLPSSNDCYLAVDEKTIRSVMQVLGRK